MIGEEESTVFYSYLALTNHRLVAISAERARVKTNDIAPHENKTDDADHHHH